jgi:hypothetical protein
MSPAAAVSKRSLRQPSTGWLPENATSWRGVVAGESNRDIATAL